MNERNYDTLKAVLAWAWVFLIPVSFLAGEPIMEFSGLLTLSVFMSGMYLGTSMEGAFGR